MRTLYFSRDDRGRKDLGWLQSHFLFSFSNYTDPSRTAFGSLTAFNDDYVAEGGGFGLHPHANMEIISVMLEGRMNHIDSLGFKNEVGPDYVQIMSAGTGLRHEEHNVGEGRVNFLQIWIQPKLQNITPRYQYRHFPEEGRRGRWKLMVGPDEGAGHCWINQNTRIWRGSFAAGESLEQPVTGENTCAFLFIIRGGAVVGSQTLHERDALGIWDTDSFRIQLSEDSDLLLLQTPINAK